MIRLSPLPLVWQIPFCKFVLFLITSFLIDRLLLLIFLYFAFCVCMMSIEMNAAFVKDLISIIVVSYFISNLYVSFKHMHTLLWRFFGSKLSMNFLVRLAPFHARLRLHELVLAFEHLPCLKFSCESTNEDPVDHHPLPSISQLSRCCSHVHMLIPHSDQSMIS